MLNILVQCEIFSVGSLSTSESSIEKEPKMGKALVDGRTDGRTFRELHGSQSIKSSNPIDYSAVE